jgi:hypothetical protein
MGCSIFDTENFKFKKLFDRHVLKLPLYYGSVELHGGKMLLLRV